MNKSLKCIIFLGLVVVILYFANISSIMKEAFDMTECIEAGKDSAPECQYRSSSKNEWKKCDKKQQKKYDKYVNEVVGAKCQQKYYNKTWETELSTDDEDKKAKNKDINHPTTLAWAVEETEEYLKDKREGDKLLKPAMAWGQDRKLLKYAGSSVLEKEIDRERINNPSIFNDFYTYLMGEGDDDEYYE